MLSRIKFEIAPLVNEMLDQLPEEIWTSKTTTFFDPAIAGGQFVREIERRLLEAGHSRKNVSGRVFGCEEYEHQVQYALNKHKLLGNYKVTNFLEQDFNMKFDVIVGNPPYQNSHKKDEEAKRKVGNKLWYQFIFKADNLVKPNGYVAMVTPNQWLTGGVNMRKGELGVLKDVFAKKQLITATVAGITEKYFKGIGISIGWWVYKNTPTTNPTTLHLKDTSLTLDFNGLEFLSPVPDELSIGIITKTMLAPNKKFESYYFNSQAKPGINGETEKKTKENKYPHWIMGSTTTNNLVLRYFSKIMNTRVGYKKVVFPMSTRYWQPHLADVDVSVTSLGQALRVPDTTTQTGFESVFYSKLFKYLCFNLQIAQNGFMKTVLVRSLPQLDMSKTWTDLQLYKHFKLTKEEINYIELNVK
jgi:site-specific DNA-methyltransferase (adenine-specific)